MALIAEREAEGRLRPDPDEDGVRLEIGWHLARMSGVLDGL
jgi:hypothetical protein